MFSAVVDSSGISALRNSCRRSGATSYRTQSALVTLDVLSWIAGICCSCCHVHLTSHVLHQSFNSNIVSPVKPPSSCISAFSGSGGASAVKESGHFEVRKSSGQVTQSTGHREGLAWPSVVANWEGGGRGLPPFPSLPLFVPSPFFASSPPLASLKSRTAKIQVVVWGVL